ncbi:hypothetical protein [Shewanella sp. YIC-542]|uniref:hypothetical protein n=1 Tax=Shewanella mytili TaxID=3377111 RepID=UPI00398E82B6
MGLIILLAIIVLGYLLFGQLQQSRHSQQQEQQRTAALQQQVDELKQRVAALETIVIDRDEMLRQKFRDL